MDPRQAPHVAAASSSSVAAITPDELEKFCKDHFPSLLCPISLDPFVRPVMAADGHVYSEAFIREWFKRPGVPNSPLTLLRFANKNTQDAHTIVKLIDEVKALAGYIKSLQNQPSDAATLALKAQHELDIKKLKETAANMIKNLEATYIGNQGMAEKYLESARRTFENEHLRLQEQLKVAKAKVQAADIIKLDVRIQAEAKIAEIEKTKQALEIQLQALQLRQAPLEEELAKTKTELTKQTELANEAQLIKRNLIKSYELRIEKFREAHEQMSEELSRRQTVILSLTIANKRLQSRVADLENAPKPEPVPAPLPVLPLNVEPPLKLFDRPKSAKARMRSTVGPRIFAAIAKGNLKEVNTLLPILVSCPEELNRGYDKYGTTLLMNAVKALGKRICADEIFKAILAAKVKLNIQDVKGNTALHLACVLNSTSAIKDLLKHGADPELVNGVGFRPRELVNYIDQKTRAILGRAEGVAYGKKRSEQFKTSRYGC